MYVSRTQTVLSEDSKDFPLSAVMITLASRSCVEGCRVLGFSSGASCQGFWVLSPWEPMTFMSQRSGRAVGRTAGKGICTSTGSLGRISLVIIGFDFGCKIIEVAECQLHCCD